MLHTYVDPKQIPNVAFLDQRKTAVKQMQKAVTGKASNKRIKILMVETVGERRAGMELSVLEAEAMQLIQTFKAKVAK